jgi:uncharacterized protein (TIGR00369 family)
MSSIPADFQPHARRSPVTDPWEPLYSRYRDGGVDLAFEVQPAHCNSRGLVHGGVLAALCDNVMGLALGVVLRRDASILTTNLTLDYLGSAKVGELVVITPRVVHAGTSLGTCDALAVSGSRTIARANASFSVRFKDAPAP